MSAPSRLRARAYVASSDDAPAVWQLGNLWRLMASGVQTDNVFTLIDQIVTPNGGGPCTHKHTQDEGLYIVSGHCTFNAGGETLSAGPGSLVVVPRLTEHSFQIDAPGTQVLNFYFPSGFELLLLGLSVPADANELPPPGVKLPPRSMVERLSADYGAIPVLGLPFADRSTEDNMATRPKPDATALPFVSHVDGVASYWRADGLWSVLADGATTDGSYAAFERLMPSGAAEAPHLHDDQDEVFCVLEGEVEFFLGDRVEMARKGSLVFVPRSTAHGLRVVSASARVLNLYTPAGYERLVTAFSQRTDLRTLPPSGWTGPEVADDRRTALEHAIGLQRLATTDPLQPTERVTAG